MTDVDDRARVLGALDAIAVPIAFLADLLEVPAIVHEEIQVLKLAHRGGPAVESALSMLDGHIGRGVGFACVMLILEDLEFEDRKSGGEGRSVSVRVDLGGGGRIKKNIRINVE